MGRNHSPRIETNGLLLHLDALNTRSYPGSGNTVFDISGNANNGTLTDMFNGGANQTPTYDTDSIAGGNFYFPNDNSTINTPIQLAGKSVTICGWVKLPDLTSTVKLWGAGSSYTYAGGGYTVVVSNSTRISDSLWGGDTAYTVSLQQNVWYHIVSTYSDVSPYRRQIYVNGALNATSPTGIQYTGTGAIRVGYYGATDTTNWGVNGYKKLAMFSVYNKVLTQEEVVKNFNAHRGRFGI